MLLMKVVQKMKQAPNCRTMCITETLIKIKCAAIVFSIRKSTHIETLDTFKTTVTLLRQQPFLL